MTSSQAPSESPPPEPPPAHNPYTPPASPSPAPPPQVANHLVWAILTTLFCCLPAGIVSIVYASKVNTLLVSGDIEGARKASKSAATWAIVSAAATVALLVLYFIVIAIGAVLGNL